MTMNDDQTVKFELPTLNEPKHGNILFETMKVQEEGFELNRAKRNGGNSPPGFGALSRHAPLLKG